MLVEIGANNLEKRGTCSKYDPLAALEMLKCAPPSHAYTPWVVILFYKKIVTILYMIGLLRRWFVRGGALPPLLLLSAHRHAACLQDTRGQGVRVYCSGARP